jgi:prolyl-tRNA editing enzyme YbaK/EbsC (Cys-tRNA(Pro) deacylase)
MPRNRKLLGAAAFSLALAGGGVAGAVLGTPNLSGAQDDPTTTTVVDPPADGTRPFGPRLEHLATAAEALGMSEADLRAALQEGQSIAQVAEANGVDVQTVVDALVADATEHLAEIEAALPERMTDLVNREGLPEHMGQGPGGRGPGGPGRHARGEGLEAAADAIGVTPEELRTALRDGSTIAEVADANDVDAQAVIDAMVAEATSHIDEAVADGHLDADRAETMKANLVERITALVNGERPAWGPGDEPAPADSDA